MAPAFASAPSNEEDGAEDPRARIEAFYEGRTLSNRVGSGAAVRAQTAARRLKAAQLTDPSWLNLGPVNIAGRILSLAFDPSSPQTVYAGSASGGIWKTIDGGTTWTPLGDELPTLAVGAIALSSQSPNTVLIGTGEPTVAHDALYGLGILRSTDAGVTWQRTNFIEAPFNPGGFHAIDVNQITGVMLAGGRNGLLRSQDDGVTWSSVSGGNWTDVKWRPASAESAFAAREQGGVYVSSDSGKTFSPLTTGLPQPTATGGLIKIAVTPSDPQYVYAGFSAADSFVTLGIYRSTDGGATWQLRSSQPNIYGRQGYYNNTLIIDPSNPDHVFAGGILLYRSVDGATTWQPLGFNVHVDHHAIAFRPGNGAELWVGTDGGIFRSTDGGANWEDRNQGLVTLQFYDVCSSASDSLALYGGSQDNGTARYLGTGTWEIRPGADGGICLCDQADSRHVYGEYAFGDHFVSSDAFNTWTTITSGLSGTSRFTAPVDLDRLNAQRLFTATVTGLFKTDDGGVHWGKVADANDVVSVSVSSIAPSRVWALERSSGIVRRSTDGGLSWTSSMATPFPGVGGTQVLADPHDSLAAFCTFLHHSAGGPLVVRTADGGISWSDVTGDLGEQSVNAVGVDPQEVSDWYVGTDVGVWVTRDGGYHWRPYGANLPNALVSDLEFQPAFGWVYAATHGRGLWRIQALSEAAPRQLIPTSMLLDLVSRSPAANQFTIGFGARGTGMVRLEVFSVQGRRISILAESPADGLERTVTWRPTGLASGICFLVLRSNLAHAARKVVLIR